MGAPWILVLSSDPQDKAALAFLLLAVVFCLFLLITSRYITIYLDEEKMVVSDALRKRTVFWADVYASSIGWELEGMHGGKPAWTIRLKDSRQVDLNLGYYSRRDMTLLARFFLARTGGAVLSQKIHDIAEGRFPWYLF
jgi:hypothetical protein